MYTIEDTLQNNLNLESYSVIRDILLGISVYLFYINSSYDVFMTFIRMILILFVIRFLLANITKITDTTTNQKHFQISGHLIILYSIIALSIQHNNFNLENNANLGWLIVGVYSLFIIGTKQQTVSDIVLSLLLLSFIFKTQVPHTKNVSYQNNSYHRYHTTTSSF
jgi:hypothetical protein